jgi:5-methylthioadenosine/S-adenosylhomocysteine deaminase
MSKQAADLLIEAPWLVPGNGLPVVADAAVVVRDGRFAAAGDRSRLNAAFEAAERCSLPDHVLLPGLVNGHGHLAMTLFRGFAEDVPLQTWLSDRVWPLEATHVDEEFIRDGVRLAMLEMLRAGTTCFSDMYFFPEITAREAKAMGMRSQVAFPVIDIPNVWSRSAEEGIHKGLALSDEYRDDPFVRVAFGPHAVYTVDHETLARVLMFSEELDLNIQIHLHENRQELDDTLARLGVSGIRHLSDQGLLGPRLQAVHMTQISDEELALLAHANVNVVHCPISNAKLGCGVCPIERLQNAGVNVGLGTDGAASNNRLSVLAEARMASLLTKLQDHDASALPAAVALDMATINGARALGMGDDTGSIEAGKWADLVAVDTRAPELQPLYDPVAQLIHSDADSNVSHVWVAGRCLLANREPTLFDGEEVVRRARRWQTRINGA